MLNTIRCRTATILAAIFLCTNALAQQAVIPGAAGFGINTPAGRGGEIIRITNLNNSGTGSLRACVQASGPRICVFEVSGTIQLESDITARNPNLTIAGQTAPAPGIMIRNASLAIETSDVLVQHLAVRAGDDPNGSRLHSRDSLKIIGDSPIRNIVIDHCSFSWAIDEVIEVWNDWDDVTLSNNIFSEPLYEAPPAAENGEPQGYGALVDSTNGKITFVGNLFAHADWRNPRSGAADFVFVNNVVYNYGLNVIFLYNMNRLVTDNSIVGNVIIDGPNSKDVLPVRITGNSPYSDNVGQGTKVYLADNLARAATADPWSIVQNNSSLSRADLEALSAPTWPTGLQALPTANNVVQNHVLSNVGSRPADRDVVDTRIIAEVRNGTGHFVNCVVNDGTSRCASNAGGWPNLANNFRSLNVPNNPNADDDRDGYSNVEEWLHAMAAEVEGGTSSAPPDEPVRPMPPAILD